MNVLIYLIPASIIMGGLGLALFFWTLRTNQYDDPDGNSQRMLSDRWDETPPED
ncbi:MAG TPA: cbb3-type cytochrome oxidase assembly protein CcoS [Aliiroseovarius sp.]|nr:cbb3-type cytochrome oxidase assembly protein CcoS [Aliiroseovarius sp.]